jgi:phage-related protein
MATFPSITPAYGETQTIEQDNIVVKLGDGYEQRLVRGLAANKRYHVISLVYNISQSQADTINTFLNARFDDQDAFQYTIGGESSARNFKCTSRSASIPYNNRITMNLTFEEVFEA